MTSDAAPSTSPALDRFVRAFAAGDRIFEQGEPGAHMYFIRSGKVRISKVSTRRVQPLAVLERGTFFGEMAVLTGEPRSARAEALVDCELIEIDAATLQVFLDQHPRAAQGMIRTLAERLRQTDELVERLLEEDPLIQVVATLEAAAARSEASPPCVDDAHSLMVDSGTDPTLLRWALVRLKRGGFVRVRGGSVEIPSLPRLRQYLNFLRLQRDLLEGRGEAPG